MKTLLAIAFVSLTGIFLFVQFGDASASVREAERYFSSEVIEKGRQYSSERRWFYWGDTFLHFGLLGLLVATSLGRRLADKCVALAGGRWLLAVLLTGLAYFAAAEVLSLPFSIGRFYHTRAWGMSDRSLASWFEDYGKGLGVRLVADGVVLVGLFLLLRWLPRWWWLPGTVFAGALAVGFAYIMPVVVAPLFNKFTPLSATPWAALEPRMRVLLDEAGVPVKEILVMDASRQSFHSNAYFTGFGDTRRIVLYDNLLAKAPPDEVESILAHEIGHWQHDHIRVGIALGTAATLVGLFILAVFLLLWVGRGQLALRSPSDPAALFLILFLAVLGEWLGRPIGNAVSRHFERQADQMSLDLAKQPAAFKAAEVRLAVDNLSNVAPLPFAVWLFSTHPPAVDRIRMAEQWQENR